jgi:hypothetical protein
MKRIEKMMTYRNDPYSNNIIEDDYQLVGIDYIVSAWNWDHSKSNDEYYCVKLAHFGSIVHIKKEDLDKKVKK